MAFLLLSLLVLSFAHANEVCPNDGFPPQVNSLLQTSKQHENAEKAGGRDAGEQAARPFKNTYTLSLEEKLTFNCSLFDCEEKCWTCCDCLERDGDPAETCFSNHMSECW